MVELENEHGVPTPEELDEIYRAISDEGDDKRREYLEQSAQMYGKAEAALMPYMDIQASTVIGALRKDSSDPFRWLDMGVGPGTMTAGILQLFPKAQVSVLDLSFFMLDVCRMQTQKHHDRMEFLQADYTSEDVGNEYDAIHCGYSLSSVPNEGKEAAISRMFDALEPGGVVSIRDVMVDADDAVQDYYHHVFKNYLRHRGMDPEQIMKIYYERMFPLSYQDHLAMIENAGFECISTDFKFLHFTCISARKPE